MGADVVLLCAQVKGAKMRVRGYGIALGHPRKHLPSSTEIKLSLRLYCECKIIIIALFAGVGVRDMLFEVLCVKAVLISPFSSRQTKESVYSQNENHEQQPASTQAHH